LVSQPSPSLIKTNYKNERSSSEEKQHIGSKKATPKPVRIDKDNNIEIQKSALKKERKSSSEEIFTSSRRRRGIKESSGSESSKKELVLTIYKKDLADLEEISEGSEVSESVNGSL